MKSLMVVVFTSVFLVTVGMTGCSHLVAGRNQGDIENLVSQLRNADVKWSLQSMNTFPVLSFRAAQVMNIGKRAIPFLLSALEDNDRYLVAHVLLLHYYGIHTETRSAWNGVPFREEGEYVVFNQYGRLAVINFWFGFLEKRTPLRSEFGADPFHEVRCLVSVANRVEWEDGLLVEAEPYKNSSEGKSLK